MGKIFLPKTLHRIWDLNSAIKNGLTFRQANSEGKHSGKMEQREQRHFLRWFTKFFQIWSLLKCPAHNYLHDIFRGGKSLNTPWRPYILFVQLHGGGNLLPLPISVSPLKSASLAISQTFRKQDATSSSVCFMRQWQLVTQFQAWRSWESCVAEDILYCVALPEWQSQRWVIQTQAPWTQLRQADSMRIQAGSLWGCYLYKSHL